MAAAIGAVWLFWGSTFAGMHLAVATIPPGLMAGARFLIAGFVLWIVALVRGEARPEPGELRNAVVTGATLLLLGNGVTAYTVQYLPTGINSLLLSLSAVWMAVFAVVATRERPTVPAMIGMALGILGLAALLRPGSTSFPLLPALIAVGASVSWSFGSIYQRRSGARSLVRSTAMQMVMGGAMLVIAAVCLGEARGFNIAAVTPSSWLGFAWLILFGSLVGYSAYLYTMRAPSVALASAYAYVNPIVALILGAIFFRERLSPTEIFAALITLAGVALMALPRRTKTAPA